METLKEFQNIILGHEIKVFMYHRNITYKTIESASQCLHSRNSLIQYFGMTLLYIKGEANVVADYFSRLNMAHHAHKFANKTLEEDTCELMCLYSLLISDNTYCFYLDIEEISFPLAPHTEEAKHKL